MSVPVATGVARRGGDGAAEAITLDYESRLLRRRKLTSDAGRPFVVDLPEVTHLDHGDALLLEGGQAIAVRAAPEPCLIVRGPNLARLAWHIGNRHTPCQIAEDHLVIRADHVLADMLRHLGASLAEEERPFTPEGGAYGHGRTFGHQH